MKKVNGIVALALILPLAVAPGAFPANHREAPITALDHKADITDVYAFVSYADPTKVTLMFGVDPLLEPGNGPNWFPFDPEILYEIKVDNDFDAKEDITFKFRFATEQRLPGVFQVYVGSGSGGVLVPPQIDSFDDPGLGMRQTYTVSMLRQGSGTTKIMNDDGSPFFVVPANVGPRTMKYGDLFDEGTYHLASGVSVFAGTVDDPFWIDLGAAFDTANLRIAILGDTEEFANYNVAPDEVAGYAVNYIAIEVPIAMLTGTGAIEPADSPNATIGVWATTSRRQITVRRPVERFPSKLIFGNGPFRQVQRMGNALINELLIGTGFKDRFSMDRPHRDAQFADPFFLDPLLPRVLNELTGGAVPIPNAPRTDLLPLVQYLPPIAAPGTPAGPVADLLRLNTGVPATMPGSPGFSRMGLLGGDPAGYPNGRRPEDDVTDISFRAVAGVLNPAFNVFPNNRIGDGVNVNDVPYVSSFPYLALAPDGRNSRHIDPGELGCGPTGMTPCLP
jgi:hypothetical protein